MALARIITRSQICSRELSLELVARGYVVEIVSPDKVPDNTADLELRVEAGPANDLVANVEAHNGGRTASLEFVHHLKAPVLDFPRRPLERGEAAQALGEPVNSITGEGNGGEAPLEFARPALGALPTVVERLANRKANVVVDTQPIRKAHVEADPGESICLTMPQVLAPLAGAPAHFAVEDAVVLHSPDVRVVQPTRWNIRRAAILREIISRVSWKIRVSRVRAGVSGIRFGGWQWSAGLAFALLVLLAGFLGGFDMRVSGKSAAAPAGEMPTMPWGLVAADTQANAGAGPKQLIKPRAPGAKSRTAVPRTHGDDFIARDTTVYFDKRYEPASKAKVGKPNATGGGSMGRL